MNVNLMEQSWRNKVRKFMFISSNTTYPDIGGEYCTEDMNVQTPNIYPAYKAVGWMKRYGETLCVNFSKQYDLPISIARPFNNYGPGLKISDGRVLSDFIKNVLNNEDIELISDGSPTRTFCYVADAIIGYLKILTRGKSGESYNIGNDKPEISMLDLAKKIAYLSSEILGYEGEVISGSSLDKEYLIDNPNRRCPVIIKAKDDLGFEPKISLEEGLKRSIYWYKDQNTHEND